MPPKRNKTGHRGRKQGVGRSSTHHNNYVNINLSDIVRRRKERGKGRTRSKRSTQTTKEPLITRFASTFAPDRKTQLINQAPSQVLGQQQPNVLQQQRANAGNTTTTQRARPLTVAVATPVKLFTPTKQKLHDAFPGVHVSKPTSYEEGDKVYCEQCKKFYTKEV